MSQVLSLDPNKAVELLRMMLLIRAFEERCIVHYTAGLIRGFLHVYIGEEAIATGVCQHLTNDDAIFATYREHGHALARGLDPGRLMAEMFGKKDGVSGGRGGSMHLFDVSRNFFGGNAIVASALPLSVGYALGLKRQQKKGLVVCFFGEGAMAEGAFHEAMNLAALWHAPILFVCENNLYAMGTALDRSQSQTNLCLRAQSYGIRSTSVDGMDVLQVFSEAKSILDDIRILSEPYFLECKTYRFRAHSMFDPDLYREPAEIALWKKRDPISALKHDLADHHVLDEEAFSTMQKEAEAIVDAATAFAQQSPDPDVSSLFDFLLAGPSTRGSAKAGDLGQLERKT